MRGRTERYPFGEMGGEDTLLLPFSMELRRSVIAAAWRRGYKVTTKATTPSEGVRMLEVRVIQWPMHLTTT